MAPEERASRPIDQPQRVPRILHLAVAGAEGLRKFPGLTAAHQGPSCPRCAGPTVHAPLAEITLRADHRVRPALAEAPPKPAEAAIVAGLLAYPKEKGGLGLLMPGFFHKELRRVWASLNVNTGARDPVDLSVGGRLCRRSRCTSTASSRARTSYPTEQRRTASRCAACDRQERR